jgi:hypothetical protein
MPRFGQAACDLLARAQARLDLARQERQQRWLCQAGQGEEDLRAFQPRGLQGVAPLYQPADDWSDWQVCPRSGGKSGKRMSDAACYNPELRRMRVRFASGGKSGTGNVYEYPGVSELEFINFLSGRLGGGRTFPVLAPRSGQQLWWGYQV